MFPTMQSRIDQMLNHILVLILSALQPGLLGLRKVDLNCTNVVEVCRLQCIDLSLTIHTVVAYSTMPPMSMSMLIGHCNNFPLTVLSTQSLGGVLNSCSIENKSALPQVMTFHRAEGTVWNIDESVLGRKCALLDFNRLLAQSVLYIIGWNMSWPHALFTFIRYKLDYYHSNTLYDM